MARYLDNIVKIGDKVLDSNFKIGERVMYHGCNVTIVGYGLQAGGCALIMYDDRDDFLGWKFLRERLSDSYAEDQYFMGNIEEYIGRSMYYVFCNELQSFDYFSEVI